jgi:hypothetical protein
MPTVEDLGHKIKAKYPGQYDDLTDAEVGRRVKAKYPGDYDDFIEVSPANVATEYIPPSSSVLTAPQVFEESGIEPITAGETQTGYRVIAVACFVIAIVLMFTASFGGCFVGVLLAIAGFTMLRSAANAYETERHEASARVDIKQSQIAFKAEVVRESQIQSEAARALELQSIRQETESKAEVIRQKSLDVAQTELDLQKHLLEIGKQQGLRPDAVSSINEHKYRTEIDLDNRWKEILQDSNAADLALIGDHLVIKKLREELTKARKERFAIKTGDDPEELKQELLADYDKFISRLEAKIDARETGHLLPENRKAQGRLTEGTPDSGTEYPAAIDGDDI